MKRSSNSLLASLLVVLLCALLVLAQTDPHPLPKFRVNGPLANFPAFAEAFQCKAGDAMVRDEKDRCVIW